MIDTFGTEPAYNHEEYATLHGYRTNWGYWNLHGQQYMTMFRMWSFISPAQIFLSEVSLTEVEDVHLLLGTWSVLMHVYACVYATERASRLRELIKSSGRNRRGFGGAKLNGELVQNSCARTDA